MPNPLSRLWDRLTGRDELLDEIDCLEHNLAIKDDILKEEITWRKNAINTANQLRKSNEWLRESIRDIEKNRVAPLEAKLGRLRQENGENYSNYVRVQQELDRIKNGGSR